jgi:peptide/nickel transport system substrate-binding protein
MSSVKGSSIKLLVNSSDSLRLRFAQEIGRMLNTSGLLVEVDARAEGYYEGALSRGEYDMYLGQTKLSPNMDLTPFFSANGALNYGGIDDIGVYTLCLQALENQGNYYTLHQRVMEDAYLIPVLFRSYAVYASRGLLTNLKPARDNLFCYSIGRTLTDAYVMDED